MPIGLARIKRERSDSSMWSRAAQGHEALTAADGTRLAGRVPSTALVVGDVVLDEVCPPGIDVARYLNYH